MPTRKKPKYETPPSPANGVVALTKELWQAAVNFFGLYDEAFLRDLIHDVVHTVKNNLKVDWTEPHREDVKATVRAAVRRELRRRNVRQEDLEPFLGYILDQAKEIYVDWPVSGYIEVNVG